MIELNGVMLISLLMSLLLIACHILFSLRNKLSIDNTTINTTIMPESSPNPLKIVVFDLDETLGSFVEISMFWEALENYYGHNLIDERFFEVLDTFPEFLRPKILVILDYLKDKKTKKTCDQIMIYTNNQGPKSWVKMISNYLNKKLNYKLFDKIIAAFKVKGKIIEIGRTSHNKSVEDLVRCTKVPNNTEICFIDDQKHPLMAQDNVYYINVKAYDFSMPYDEMANLYYDLFAEKYSIEDSKEEFTNKIVTYMNRYTYKLYQKSEEEYNADVVISKQILIHLEDFFKNGRSQNTRKRRKQRKQGTKKNYR
jgi:hypothetical protein